jgi:hypothetical protein
MSSLRWRAALAGAAVITAVVPAVSTGPELSSATGVSTR